MFKAKNTNIYFSDCEIGCDKNRRMIRSWYFSGKGGFSNSGLMKTVTYIGTRSLQIFTFKVNRQRILFRLFSRDIYIFDWFLNEIRPEKCIFNPLSYSVNKCILKYICCTSEQELVVVACWSINIGWNKLLQRSNIGFCSWKKCTVSANLHFSAVIPLMNKIWNMLHTVRKNINSHTNSIPVPTSCCSNSYSNVIIDS